MADRGTDGRFLKGSTGNPGGRPERHRSLTRLVEAAMEQIITYGNEKMRRKQVMAILLAQIASEGKVTFPDGTQLLFSGAQWVETVFKVITFVDGPPRMAHDVEVTGNLLLWDLEVKNQRVDELSKET